MILIYLYYFKIKIKNKKIDQVFFLFLKKNYSLKILQSFYIIIFIFIQKNLLDEKNKELYYYTIIHD